MSKTLIGTTETAALLGLSRAAVNKRVAAGTLVPAGEVGPRAIRVFDRAEIERLAEKEKAK